MRSGTWSEVLRAVWAEMQADRLLARWYPLDPDQVVGSARSPYRCPLAVVATDVAERTRLGVRALVDGEVELTGGWRRYRLELPPETLRFLRAVDDDDGAVDWWDETVSARAAISLMEESYRVTHVDRSGEDRPEVLA